MSMLTPFAIKPTQCLTFYEGVSVLCPQILKANLHSIYIKPYILEYAAPAWAPYIEGQIHKLKSIERCAAHFIMSDYIPP